MANQYHTRQAGLSPAERLLIDSLVRQGKFVVQGKDLDVKNPKLTLSRLSKKGWLQRLKAGVYRIVPLGSDSGDPVPEDPKAIGMAVFAPCYIGGWTAAEHWGLTEQIFNVTIVMTARRQRTSDQQVAGLTFKTRYMQQRNFFGTTKIWSTDQAVLLSDLHRTLIDILHDPIIGGGGRALVDIARSYAEKKNADLDTLWQYAQQLDQGAVFKRLGFLADRVMHLPDDYLAKVRAKCKSGVILLDPRGPKTGPIITDWGLRVNIPLQDIV
jgi:predicted transcriptional regulator of viral defense system